MIRNINISLCSIIVARFLVNLVRELDTRKKEWMDGAKLFLWTSVPFKLHVQLRLLHGMLFNAVNQTK